MEKKWLLAWKFKEELRVPDYSPNEIGQNMYYIPGQPSKLYCTLDFTDNQLELVWKTQS